MNVIEIRNLKKNIDLSILLIRQRTEERTGINSLLSSLELSIDLLVRESIAAKQDLHKIKRVIRE